MTSQNFFLPELRSRVEQIVQRDFPVALFEAIKMRHAKTEWRYCECGYCQRKRHLSRMVEITKGREQRLRAKETKRRRLDAEFNQAVNLGSNILL